MFIYSASTWNVIFTQDYLPHRCPPSPATIHNNIHQDSSTPRGNTTLVAPPAGKRPEHIDRKANIQSCRKQRASGIMASLHDGGVAPKQNSQPQTSNLSAHQPFHCYQAHWHTHMVLTLLTLIDKDSKIPVSDIGSYQLVVVQHWMRWIACKSPLLSLGSWCPLIFYQYTGQPNQLQMNLRL